MKNKSTNSLVRRSIAKVRTFGRATMTQIEALTGGAGGPEAGKTNRLAGRLAGVKQTQNSIDRANIANIRARSRQLYLDNPHARKICTSLASKVVGCNSRPQSQAVLPDGQPHIAFRKRATELWDAISQEIDYRGKPGRGGQSMADMMKTAFISTILDGEALAQFRSADLTGVDEKLRMRERMPDLRIQLIHAERLDDSVTDDNTFAGIELDSSDRPVAYRILNRHPADPRGADRSQFTRVAAQQMIHLYVVEDADAFRGMPWFSAALFKIRDIGDYEFNELTAAAMSSCVVMSVTPATGQSSDFGLESPTTDLEDADGNTLTHMQPGMIFRGKDISGFDPGRPNPGLIGFVQHLLRSVAVSVPGIKGSTLTGDFRGSSFASERSADNDAWPEVKCLQDWFHGNFSQPIYERVISEGVLSGWFDGVENFDETEFFENQRNYLGTQWQGPVALSINPKDDAKAARERIRNGSSSVQREASVLATDWRQVLAEHAEFIKEAKRLGIPDDVIAQALGIDQNNSGQNDLDDSEPVTSNGNTAEENEAATEAAIAA